MWELAIFGSFPSGFCPVRVVLLPDRYSITSAEQRELERACAKPSLSGSKQGSPETKRGAWCTVTGPRRSAARRFAWIRDTAAGDGNVRRHGIGRDRGRRDGTGCARDVRREPERPRDSHQTGRLGEDQFRRCQGSVA